MPERLVVVGGIAGGMTAATWARRQSSTIEIIVIEQDTNISYSQCGMPYVFSQQVGSLDELIRYQPEQLQAARDIEILTGCRAESLNVSSQSLEAHNLRNNTSRKLYFDYLVLATGARPILPDLPGKDLPGVFTLRHMPEARALDSYLKSAAPRRALIVGAGYLGLEMAEALCSRGLKVTIIEESGQVLKSFPGKLQERILEELRAHQVELLFGQTVTGVEGRTQVERVHTTAGSFDSDLLLFSIGVAPQVALAQAAGIRLGASGAIAVKETQQTNLPNIYAAGDCCEVHNLVSDQPAYIPLGTTANKQGRVAGINVAGGRAQFKGVVGTMVVKVFNLEAAHTGLSEAAAQAAGFLPHTLISESISRAGYYPGAQRINTEIIYDQRTGRLLGAHMVGGEGVAKRIDVFATALYARLRIEDLLQLDLSYAPPFAPVWDPIIYAVRKAEKP
ncbi:MAG: FAD-dependent oxidoreductase [Acidobacteriota bacterium]